MDAARAAAGLDWAAASARARRIGWGRWAPLVFCLALAALAGALAGPDAGWDLRNYHLYDGMALLRGRVGFDLAPAQLQSFYAPDLDVLYALALRALNARPALLDAVLALPHGLAAFLAWLVARRMLPARMPGARGLAAAAAAIGVTGAGGLPTVASPMSEMLPASCVLGALLLLLARPGGGSRAMLAAGVLAGIAVGLKLTAAPYAVGLAVAAGIVGVLRVPPPSRPGLTGPSAHGLSGADGRVKPGHDGGAGAVRALAWFLAGAAAGAAVTGGWWWLWLWARTGDPVFPYFNQVFHSPWAAAAANTDARFLPRDGAQALAYPLFWAFAPSRLVSELPVRDPRILLGWLAVLAIGARAVRRRRWPEPGLAAPLALWVVGYVLWEAQFSILRYLATLELLSGPLLLAALAPLLARMPPWRGVAAGAALAASLVVVTVYPDWGRAPAGKLAVAVRLPALAPGSLVLLLDPAPMAYAAAFAPGDVRFAGADNNLVRPGGGTALDHAVAAAITAQRGALWGMETVRREATATLRAYGLARAPGCVRVRSNLDDDAILACPLIRTRAPPVRRTGPSPPAPADAASGRR